MKKVLFTLSLLVFVGTIGVTTYAATNDAGVEVVKNDDDKKKKSKKVKKGKKAKKGSCTKSSGSCCSGKKS